jgi:hypothetical protein
MYAHDKERLDSAVKFTELKAGYVKCDALGIENGSYTEFGKAINDNPDVRAAVVRYLGITKFPDVQDADIDYDAGNVVEKKKKKW